MVHEIVSAFRQHWAGKLNKNVDTILKTIITNTLLNLKHFIFTAITTFGPLKCSLITTTRKFFTVLGSVFIFNNPMSLIQWIGTSLVFIGLGLDSKYGKEIKPEKEKVKA